MRREKRLFETFLLTHSFCVFWPFSSFNGCYFQVKRSPSHSPSCGWSAGGLSLAEWTGCGWKVESQVSISSFIEVVFSLFSHSQPSIVPYRLAIIKPTRRNYRGQNSYLLQFACTKNSSIRSQSWLLDRRCSEMTQEELQKAEEEEFAVGSSPFWPTPSRKTLRYANWSHFS